MYGTEDLTLPQYTRLEPEKCLVSAAIKAEECGGGLSALYVKKSQAEEEREKRINGV